MNKMLRTLIAPLCMLFVMGYASEAKQHIKLKGAEKTKTTVRSIGQEVIDSAEQHKTKKLKEAEQATENFEMPNYIDSHNTTKINQAKSSVEIGNFNLVDKESLNNHYIKKTWVCRS